VQLTANNSALLNSIQTSGVAAIPMGASPEEIALRAEMVLVHGALPVGFVGANLRAAGAGITMGHHKALMILAARQLIGGQAGPWGNSVLADVFATTATGDPVTSVPAFTDYRNALGAPAGNWDAVITADKHALAAKTINEVIAALNLKGVTRMAMRPVKGALEELSRAFIAQLEASTQNTADVANTDAAAANLAHRSGFVIPRSAARWLNANAAGAAEASVVRPSNLNNISIPMIGIVTYPNPMPSYYESLLTGIALRRGNPLLPDVGVVAFTAAGGGGGGGVAAADAARALYPAYNPRSTGALVRNRGRDFESAGSGSLELMAMAGLFLVDVRENYNNLAMLVERSIPIPFGLQLFHPVELAGDPMICIEGKAFNVMSAVDEAFMEIDYFRGKIIPTMSGWVNAVCRDDKWSYILDLACLRNAGELDVARPAHENAFRDEENYGQIGYLGALTNPNNGSRTTFTSVVGRNVIPGATSTFEENDGGAQYDNAEQLVDFYGFSQNDLPQPKSLVSSNLNGKPSYDFNSKPGSYNLRTKSGATRHVVTDYLFGQVPIVTGALNAFFDGSLVAKNPFA
jgi:hypothetical protein